MSDFFHSAKCLRFIHDIIAWISHSFLLMIIPLCVKYSWTYPFSFNGLFPIWGYYEYSSTSLWVAKFSILLGKYLWVELDSLIIWCMHGFTLNCQTTFQSNYTSLHSHQQWMFQLLHIFASTWYSQSELKNFACYCLHCFLHRIWCNYVI